MKISANAPDPTTGFVPVQKPEYDSYAEERYNYWRNEANRLEAQRDALIKANDALLAKLNNLNVTANWTGYDN